MPSPAQRWKQVPPAGHSQGTSPLLTQDTAQAQPPSASDAPGPTPRLVQGWDGHLECPRFPRRLIPESREALKGQAAPGKVPQPPSLRSWPVPARRTLSPNTLALSPALPGGLPSCASRDAALTQPGIQLAPYGPAWMESLPRCRLGSGRGLPGSGLPRRKWAGPRPGRPSVADACRPRLFLDRTCRAACHRRKNKTESDAPVRAPAAAKHLARPHGREQGRAQPPEPESEQDPSSPSFIPGARSCLQGRLPTGHRDSRQLPRERRVGAAGAQPCTGSQEVQQATCSLHTDLRPRVQDLPTAPSLAPTGQLARAA
ncbi:uncharacterized protein LOC115838393 [Nomascus leucogenys]|uniref:uncharacterized protein LOC115838393 n=1 Tax=Nomascus leucogenys TaxID=61853 RepID=UPI00122D5B81|nr:uncharacterized protein LOC115838393 [Nomascus leucogenys]